MNLIDRKAGKERERERNVCTPKKECEHELSPCWAEMCFIWEKYKFIQTIEPSWSSLEPMLKIKRLRCWKSGSSPDLRSGWMYSWTVCSETILSLKSLPRNLSETKVWSIRSRSAHFQLFWWSIYPIRAKIVGWGGERLRWNQIIWDGWLITKSRLTDLKHPFL